MIMLGNNFDLNYFIPINKNLFATETPIAPKRPEGKFPPQVQALASSPMSISVEERRDDPSQPPATMKTCNTIQLNQSILFWIGLSSCPTPQIFTGKSRAAEMCFCCNIMQRRLELWKQRNSFIILDSEYTLLHIVLLQIRPADVNVLFWQL